MSGTAITVQHRYDEGDTYTATVRVTDTLGTVVNAATVIVVLDQPPAAVTISKAAQPSGPNTNYTLTATVTPSSVIVANYQWTRDDDVLLQTGGSNQILLTFPANASTSVYGGGHNHDRQHAKGVSVSAVARSRLEKPGLPF